MRSYIVYALLLVIKVISRIFYRHDFRFIGEIPKDPWANLRVVALLNHTSLYEPLFLGIVPSRFAWRVARHGVLPAADKTIKRPFVGIIFRTIAAHVVSVTRERDNTWFEVLRKIDPDSMVVILPEGRMMRKNGLDSHGNPMTVRGGISDVLEAVGEGRMLLAYSGGLHHVQHPGEVVPRAFKKIALRVENLDIASYIAGIKAQYGDENFKRGVMADLERRRDENCPVQPGTGGPAKQLTQAES